MTRCAQLEVKFLFLSVDNQLLVKKESAGQANLAEC